MEFDVSHGIQSFKEWSRLVLHLALRICRSAGGLRGAKETSKAGVKARLTNSEPTIADPC